VSEDPDSMSNASEEAEVIVIVLFAFVGLRVIPVPPVTCNLRSVALGTFDIVKVVPVFSNTISDAPGTPLGAQLFPSFQFSVKAPPSQVFCPIRTPDAEMRTIPIKRNLRHIFNLLYFRSLII
jgi:hypothetical protein